MAELLGVISGGAGLASLAIQLAESAQKLKGLYKAYRDAPQFLQDLSEDFRLFGLMLNVVERDRVTYNTADAGIVADCVKRCQRAVRRVEEAVGKLEAAIDKSNRLGRLRTAFQGQEIARLRDELVTEKDSLHFAWDLYQTGCMKHEYERVVAAVHAQTALLRAHDHALQSMQEQLSTLPQRLRDSGSETGSIVMATAATYTPTPNAHCTSTTLSLEGRKPRRRRVSLKPWSLSQIWDLSFGASYAGWNFMFRIANEVSSRSLIFELCAAGDLIGVKRLFQDGLAGPRDYAGLHRSFVVTPLTQAIGSNHIDLYRFLLDRGGASPGFQHYVGVFGLKANDSNAAEWYQMMIRHFDTDSTSIAGLLDPSQWSSQLPEWWLNCPNASCWSIIAAELPFNYYELPLATRFSIASISAHKFNRLYFLHGNRTFTSDLFLAMVGCSANSPAITTISDIHGNTALHIAVKMVTHRLGNWDQFLVALIRSGADRHRQNKYKHTPFSAFISGLIAHMPGRQEALLQSLIRSLDEAGVDLQNFGEIEEALWTPWNDVQEISGDVRDRPGTTWTYGPSITDWTVSFPPPVEMGPHVPIYEAQLEAPPGTWPSQIEPWSRTICWSPREDTLEMPWRWRHMRDLEIPCDGCPSPCRTSVRSSHEVEVCLRLADSQDDCGALCFHLSQATKSRGRLRSQSQPPVMTSSRLVTDRPITRPRGWGSLNYLHFCSMKSRWVLTTDFPFCDRNCLREHKDCDLDELWTDRDGINNQILRFRRRYRNVEELRALPYAAYHPRWRIPHE